MANPFVHVELNTTDLRKAKAFYGKLFKWKLKDTKMPKGTYTMIDVGTGTGGGMMKQLIPGAGSAWMPYVLVKDLDAATQQAAEWVRLRRARLLAGERGEVSRRIAPCLRRQIGQIGRAPAARLDRHPTGRVVAPRLALALDGLREDDAVAA